MGNNRDIGFHWGREDCCEILMILYRPRIQVSNDYVIRSKLIIENFDKTDNGILDIPVTIGIHIGTDCRECQRDTSNLWSVRNYVPLKYDEDGGVSAQEDNIGTDIAKAIEEGFLWGIKYYHDGLPEMRKAKLRAERREKILELAKLAEEFDIDLSQYPNGQKLYNELEEDYE